VISCIEIKPLLSLFLPINEEKLIGKVLKTIPAFIDHIVVVDDASRDRTGEVVKAHLKEDPRIIYIHHTKNEGVGGAIVTGYKWAREKLVQKANKINWVHKTL
jgi:glycosyltransferase involved in cell wall biosynthesis